MTRAKSRRNVSMRMTIIAVGKIKERFYQDAIKEYMKRLTRYAKINVIEIPDEKCPESMSEAQMLGVKEKEGERILAKIPEGSYPIALAIEGKMLRSGQLSEKLASLTVNGISHVTWIIGGSLGLSDTVKKRCKFLLSFSPMTFPHQMMRVILVEQVYRAFRIMKNETYHKGCPGDVDMQDIQKHRR